MSHFLHSNPHTQPVSRMRRMFHVLPIPWCRFNFKAGEKFIPNCRSLTRIWWTLYLRRHLWHPCQSGRFGRDVLPLHTNIPSQTKSRTENEIRQSIQHEHGIENKGINKTFALNTNGLKRSQGNFKSTQKWNEVNLFVAWYIFVVSKIDSIASGRKSKVGKTRAIETDCEDDACRIHSHPAPTPTRARTRTP